MHEQKTIPRRKHGKDGRIHEGVKSRGKDEKGRQRQGKENTSYGSRVVIPSWQHHATLKTGAPCVGGGAS
jgi:hypothetical protein